jgi:hypothetical protein
MKFQTTTFFLAICLLLLANCKQQPKLKNNLDNKLLFEDTGTKNWKEKWSLDGLKANVINTKLGMELKAGTEHGNDSCHAVLWTKKIFSGNFKMNYEYIRTDTVTRCVNIIYLLATGEGTDEFPEDISKWKDKRRKPKMKMYYNNMNTYHISYAAFDAKEYSGENDYIRFRKYNPYKEGLKGTNLKPDYHKTGLFKPFITYAIEIIKTDDSIKMNITNLKNPDDKLRCEWDISKVDNLKTGRIGLRHMYTRSAIYKNIKIHQLN